MFCVRWANIYSQLFSVSNAARQGGIMSPILFNVYMDNLSLELNKALCGCNINGVYVHNLIYADDSCQITPSPSALQQLLNICASFANDNYIMYNENK